ncbi:sigma factor-like helix-turn-helix DNA-binding protein [Vibrio vulnificus]|uniref:sigma factor-like helix-turn-helix DNA-binding protein n=1 Tax=Vibrio vulnificus TaxID=672 RepID=UPI0018F7E497|nr:sigma factor-like helix-turn-helix DNA-binding protein [Vibrio vulnificus]EGQ8025542.1 hypothetical protein [Vibrio vulnificus]EHH2471105.1 hypothetical protein [Vibrio vulnificus]EHU5125630.1 hypothetical protein [Vibrio vulnificus]EHW0625361.1 hypothetical protein [Vibrio vulnificus]
MKMEACREKQSDELSEKVIERASKIPVDAIGLPARARNIIATRRLKNSYEAISIVLSGFSGVDGVGAKTISESQALVFRFINTIESASEEEVLKLIDPRETYLSSANGNLVESFQAIVELYFSKLKTKKLERDKDVLYKRFGLNGENKYTLEDLGTYYDITRERVRQIEAKSIKEIGLLLNDGLNQKEWKICNKIVQSYTALNSKFEITEWLINKDDVERVFLDFFNDTLEENYLDLFMEVCGYIKFPRSVVGFRGQICESWCKSAKYKKSEFESIFQALDSIYDKAESIPIFDFIVSAKKKRKSNSAISNESIKMALLATKDIEYDGKKITVKFTRLRSAADKAVRILESHGKPMHFAKVAQEINLLSKSSAYSTPIKETNLKNQFVSDSRFTPIGRSGEWGLTAWGNLNNITIIEAIEKVLHDAGAPLKFSDIKERVAKLRPDASQNSLKVYLHDQPKFVRVGKSEFALSTWRMQGLTKEPKRKSVSVKYFNQAIKTALQESNPIDFPKLTNKIIIMTNLSEVSVRQRLLSTDGIDIRREKGKRCKVVYCNDLNVLDDVKAEKTFLLELLQDEIRSILFEQPNIPIKKGDLYKEVSKNISCLRPTFYSYLDRMNDIHTYKKGNDYFAVYHYEEVVEKIEIDISKYTSDVKTKELLKRPLSFLTIDDVDISLFEFGLLFETTLKQYLLEQKNKGTITVSSKDTSKLVNMIACVVREGIVTKGHHLSTLREERNNRAHGNVPSIEERKQLFNKAYYISDLFVKYICFFQNKLD